MVLSEQFRSHRYVLCVDERPLRYWATFPTSRDLNVCVNVAARAPATSGPWPHRGTPGSGGLDEYSVVWTVERRIGISREPLAQEKHKRA